MVMRNQDASEWPLPPLAETPPPCEQSFLFVFFLLKVERGGSAHAWIALSLSSRLSLSFWTNQSCFISSGFWLRESVYIYSWISLKRPSWGQEKVAIVERCTVVERFKQASMYGLLAKKKNGRGREVTVSGGSTVYPDGRNWALYNKRTAIRPGF